MTVIHQVLQEAWGDIVNRDFEDFDGLTNSWAARRAPYHTNLRDRQEGRYLPVYEDEMDLRAIRQAAWLLCEHVPMAKSIIRGLLNYTISKGYDWKVIHPDAGVQKLCESVLKSFCDNSKWQEAQERDSFITEVIDGEYLAEIHVDGSDICLEPLQGDNLTEPARAYQLEEWLDLHCDMSWTFGIARKAGRSRNLYYHIVRNVAGTDWDCLPPDRVVHWTRNVPIAAKRGFSDFYSLHRYITKADKVIDNTAVGAAIQAAIAYIVEHAPTATKSSAEALVSSLRAVTNVSDPIVAGNGSVRTKKIASGTRLDIPAGGKYHASLLGSNASKIYIEVMESLLRLAASMYHFPEHMITGYAGNNNMASSLVAESPFVQGRLADQQLRARRTETLFLKVLKAFFGSPWAKRLGKCWDDVRVGLEVTCQLPQIVSRDPLELTQTLTAQMEAGLISKRTASQDLGRDYETEQKNIAEEGPSSQPSASGAVGPDGQPLQQQPALGGEFKGAGRRSYVNARRATSDILEEVRAGTLTRAEAEVHLSTIGLSDSTIKRLLDIAAGPGKPLAESFVRFHVGTALREAGWDASKHPKGKDGRFITKGQIDAAAGDPAKAKALMSKVRPEDRAALRSQIKAAGKPGQPDKPPVKPAKSSKRLEEPAAPVRVQQVDVTNGFKHKGVFGTDGEMVRKKNVNLDQAQDAINQRAASFLQHYKAQTGQSVGGGEVNATRVGKPADNPAVGDWHADEIGKATSFLKQVVGPGIKADVNWSHEGGRRREEYEPSTGTIHMAGVQPIHSAFIHEAAHHIEKSNPEVAAKVKAFREKRIADTGAKPVEMGSFGVGYKPGEVGVDAGFSKAMGSPARGAYTGMVYKDGMTEVLSMGLQRLHANPAKFFKDDPEYATFVVDVLNGRG